MDFDFLTELPKSNLDDRTFRDLVEECRLRIPRYCPEWTNYNPGDPGITFIELFAWLTDQMLLRFNQVPRLNYVTFLELMGIRLQPSKPARTELTFYLSKAQPFPITIKSGTEVATVRSETEAAIVFTTDADLAIGTPTTKQFITANVDPNADINKFPSEEDFQTSFPHPGPSGENVEERPLFANPPQPNNCFYLVLDEAMGQLAGNVIALTFYGEPARSTGIDPNNPPLNWQAWNGEKWCNVLRVPANDKTKGFSFAEVAQQGFDPLNDGADVILHLPQKLPIVSLPSSTSIQAHSSDNEERYSGYWIRCVYRKSQESQPGYSVSPTIVGLSVRSIGGTVNASHCVVAEEELLGISNGKPGQRFQLQNIPVLSRDLDKQEHIQVRSSGYPVEDWQEVSDFSSSKPTDLHYTIDAITGTVQFGPRVQEPERLKHRTQQPAQAWGSVTDCSPARESSIPPAPSTIELEQQYGKVPPPGAEIYMRRYRSGGGTIGNVQAERLTVVKTAIPYVKNVTNYSAAEGGKDAESLAQAVMRIPELLRTREAAVTPEDFERLAIRSPVAIARARCLRHYTSTNPGTVLLLIVPDIDRSHQSLTTLATNGLNPDAALHIETQKDTLKHYIDDRKPLGVRVQYEQPTYIRVKAHVEVILHDNYLNQSTQVKKQLQTRLFEFLNPVIGGIHGNGWEWGRPVYPSDVIAQCQAIEGVRYVSTVKLFSARKIAEGQWEPLIIPEPVIRIGADNLICSWKDDYHPEERDDNYPEETGEHVIYICN
jgi:predicted phage baseplate assembly protein